MNSSKILVNNRHKYPDSYAIKSEYGHLTYLELNQRVNSLSNALLERRIKLGDKIILFMPNTLEFVISYFAIQRIGAIVVPLNIELTKTEIDHILDDANPKAIIVHNLVFDSMRDLNVDILKIKTGKGNLNWLSFLEITDQASSDEVDCLLTEDDLSTLLYTTDRADAPKRVLFNYRSILAVSHMLRAEMEVNRESRILLMLQLNHAASFHLFLMGSVIAGSTLVLRTTFRPHLLIEAVEWEKTTHFFGTPEVYLLMAKELQNKEANFSSMHWWIYDDLPINQDEIALIKTGFKTDNFVCINMLTEDDANSY